MVQTIMRLVNEQCNDQRSFQLSPRARPHPHPRARPDTEAVACNKPGQLRDRNSFIFISYTHFIVVVCLLLHHQVNSQS